MGLDGGMKDKRSRVSELCSSLPPVITGNLCWLPDEMSSSSRDGGSEAQCRPGQERIREGTGGGAISRKGRARPRPHGVGPGTGSPWCPCHCR